jgi:hypothetical protein
MNRLPELTVRVALATDDADAVRESFAAVLTHLDGDELAGVSPVSFTFFHLSEWEEPATFPWNEEARRILDDVDLVVADPAAHRSALAYLAGRGVPFVAAADPGDPSDASLVSRLLAGVRIVITEYRHRSDTACIAALGYSANGLALANAAALNQTAGVGALLRIGVSPDSVDAAGIPALNRAIRAAAWECVELLLEAGSSVDRPAPDRDATPLMELASTRRHDLIHQCLSRVSEIDHQSGSGQTALTIAVGAKDTETALALLDCGADPYIKDSLGMTAARYAEMFGLSEVLARLS